MPPVRPTEPFDRGPIDDMATGVTHGPRLLGLDQTELMPTHSSHAEGPGAMASPLEAALAGLWAAALQVKTVGRNHDFLTLGGDSLGFTSLLTSVNTLFGVSLKIELLSGDDATVAGMAQTIEANRARSAADERRTHGPQGLRFVDGPGWACTARLAR